MPAKKPKKDTDGVILVHMNPKGSWRYPKSLFPAGWFFDGGDHFIAGRKKPRYVRTEWFYGRPRSLPIMHKRLKARFRMLKEKGLVSSYRIEAG